MTAALLESAEERIWPLSLEPGLEVGAACIFLTKLTLCIKFVGYQTKNILERSKECDKHKPIYVHKLQKASGRFFVSGSFFKTYMTFVKRKPI